MLLDFGEEVPALDVSFSERLAVFGTEFGASLQAIAEPATSRRLKLRRFKQRQLVGVIGEDDQGREFLFLPRKTTASVPYKNVYLCPHATDVEAFGKRDDNVAPELLIPLPLNPKSGSDKITEVRNDVSTSCQWQLNIPQFWQSKIPQFVSFGSQPF